MITAISTDLNVLAADSDGIVRFKGTAYTSTPVILGWLGKVIVNLASFAFPKKLPMFEGHDSSKSVGHTTKLLVKDGKLEVEGVIYSDDADGAKIISKANQGFPWKFSIGWDYAGSTSIPKGQKVKVNGKTFSGPITVLEKNRLREISFTPIPKDKNTKAIIFSDDETNNTQLQIDGDQKMSDENNDQDANARDYEAELKVKDDQILKLSESNKALSLAARESKLEVLGIKLSDDEKVGMMEMSDTSFILFTSKIVRAEASEQADDKEKIAESKGLFSHQATDGRPADAESEKNVSLVASAQALADASEKRNSHS